MENQVCATAGFTLRLLILGMLEPLLKMILLLHLFFSMKNYVSDN